jgi:hypothetical protein
MTHRPVMDRLADLDIAVTPDRDLLDAISAWKADPQHVGLLEYTGLRPTELAAIVVDRRSVGELVDARRRRAGSIAAAAA